MKKIMLILSLTIFGLIFITTSCVSLSFDGGSLTIGGETEKEPEELGNPNEYVLIFGNTGNFSDLQFAQTNSSLEPCNRGANEYKDSSFYLTPVKKGGTYHFFSYKSFLKKGITSIYDANFLLGVQPNKFDFTPSKCGLYFFGEFSEQEEYDKSFDIKDVELIKTEEAELRALKTILNERFTGTVWESVILERIEELEK